MRRVINPPKPQSRPRPQLGAFVPPAKNQLVPKPKWKRKPELKGKHPTGNLPTLQNLQSKKKKPSLKSTFAPTKSEIDRRPIVYFDLTIDGVPAGTVFFELFNETVPKTAENFRVLTTGKYYFIRSKLVQKGLKKIKLVTGQNVFTLKLTKLGN